ncbi:MAG: hypothetical protein VX201_06205, partial [Pseudomonadota bacterium]|nr:hypothetical protein [Pseudomonadota bacterium]
AIALYRSEQGDNAVELLSGHLSDHNIGHLAHFHTAFAYDSQGDEKKALRKRFDALKADVRPKDPNSEIEKILNEIGVIPR